MPVGKTGNRGEILILYQNLALQIRNYYIIFIIIRSIIGNRDNRDSCYIGDFTGHCLSN